MEITFDTENNKIIVDGVEYTNATDYLAVYPDRTEDCVAMGWQTI